MVEQTKQTKIFEKLILASGIALSTSPIPVKFINWNIC
jgi:hypothetical protein